MFADLHLHTFFSDGTYSPEEMVAHATRHRLSALALTDHDTLEGCARAAAACALLFATRDNLVRALHAHASPETAAAATLIAGTLVALTWTRRAPTRRRGRGRPIRPTFQQVRQDRIREMVARLNRLHIPLPVDSVFAIANCRSPGRPHVGRALVMGGFCATLDEAFERFLKKNRPAWVPKFKISALEAIELIHDAGGLAVMAHPGLNRTDELIPSLVRAGLDGLECFHTKHTPVVSAHYIRLAREHDLAITGGSDCHGLSKGKPLIGTVEITYEYVKQLKTRLRAGPAAAPGSAPRTPH